MHHHSIVGLLDKTPKLPNVTYVYMLLFEKLRDPVTFSTYEIAGSRNLVVQISQKGMQDMIFGEMGRRAESLFRRQRGELGENGNLPAVQFGKTKS